MKRTKKRTKRMKCEEAALALGKKSWFGVPTRKFKISKKALLKSVPRYLLEI